MTDAGGDQSLAPPAAQGDVQDDEQDAPDAGSSFAIVGVGASAGGLEAFTQLLKALPADTGMAFVLVQHLAPSHPSALADILSRVTKMPVMEVRDGSTVEANHVYVIPPDRGMVIAGGALQLLPREGRVHRPVDEFFHSLAQEHRHQAIGVVLSGTATDGTLGLEAIKAEGGITFAQDATAQHDGMPHSAIASGCVDFVLPPGEIAREIVRIGQHPYGVPQAPVRETDDKQNLAQVVQVLRHATGVDFTGYKFNTLYRRVTRRMVFQKLDSLGDYVQYLRQTPAEVDALYQDILISVTSFFRDKESFEALKSQVFPRLLKDRSRHDPVRLWTLGCSTGQEAYSLAIAFTEAAEAAGSAASLQLFASDLNATGIEKARTGIYPMDIAQDVSPERLRRFFTEVDGQYRVSKAIRDACVFSRHNVLADPPFSRIDLISCRNLLIYLEPVLQQKIMPTLHYALKPEGCLWLGGSETIGTYRNLFDAQDAKHKIYARKPGVSPGPGHFPLQHGGLPRSPFTPITARPSEAADLHREADRLLSAKFAPPGVLVSAELDILQYRGDTGPYLAPAPGKASLNLLKMLREGLLVAVRAAVLRAGKQPGPVREEGLRVKSSGGWLQVAVEVIAIKAGEGKEGGFLVLFDDQSKASRAALAPVEDAGEGALRAPSQPGSPDPDDARLRQELAATREFLQSVIEQQEAANEELQSANEEVQSANEELQSTNEEMETSKEEIQSSNEELATVNDELNNRNAELDRANNDLVNLLGSVQMAIVMVGPDLRVRRFTPTAGKLLNLIPADIGRPLADIKLSMGNLQDLEPLLAEVLDTVSAREREVQDKHGHWYSLRLRPYRTLDNKIDGVVLMLVDIDAIKRAQAYTESIVATVREPLVVLDQDLRVQTASRSFYQTFHVMPESTENRVLFELGNGQWDIPDLRRLLEEVLPRDNQVNDFAVQHEFEHIGKRTMILNARRLMQATDQAPLILLAIEDITERKQAEEAVRKHQERYQTLFSSIDEGFCVIEKVESEAGEPLDFRYVEANPAFAVQSGMSGVIGKTIRQVAPGEAEEWFLVYDAVLTTGEPIRFERALVSQGRLLELYAFRVEDETRRRVAVIFKDVTEHMQIADRLRESEERFRHLADNIPQLAWTADAGSEGQVNWFNQRWFAYTGTTLEEMKGSGWKAVHHPDHVDRVAKKFEHHVREGLDWEDTFPLRGKDGSYRWFLSRMKVIRDESGTVVRIFGTNTDVTEERAMADALRQNAADMAEADRRKNEFLAMLAHELRNPLAPIHNAVQVLRLAKGGGEAVQSATAMMERQIRQMVRLVDDLLDVGRISRGRIALRQERVDLASVMNDAVEAARHACAGGELELTVTLPSKPIALNADPTRLVQVLGNLLSNACKFADKGGRIQLSAGREGGQAVIRVRDSGIGIAADQLARIFEMFAQVDTSLERPVSGLGIGLTLARNLVELHGGTVEVLSAGIGQGSEFVVRLPIGADVAESPAPSPALAQTPPTIPRRILVVDDNRDSAITLAELLKLNGHETRTAFDGLEGVEAATAFRPDVVLLDIGLPKLNGYDVCRRIRAEPWGKDIAMVALTGWGPEQQRENASEAGFSGHMVKPVDLGALMKLLGELRPRRPD